MPSKQYIAVSWTCQACNPDHGETHPDVQFCIFGYEICPSTGKPHLQGYYQFKKKITLKWYKENICASCHVEQSLGTPDQNVKYCSKEGKVTQYGQLKKQGRRTDLENVVDEVKSGTPLIQVIRDHPTTYIRNYRGIKDAMCALAPPEERKVEVFTYGQIGYESPSGDVYYHDSQLGYRGYAYHGQENMVVYNGSTGDWLYQKVLSGEPFCINDVPCRVTKVFVQS